MKDSHRRRKTQNSPHSPPQPPPPLPPTANANDNNFCRYIGLFALMVVCITFRFIIALMDFGVIHEAPFTFFTPNPPDFSVQSFSFTNSSNHPAVNFNVRFEIFNPSHKTHEFINYKDFLVLFRLYNEFNKSDLVFSKVVPPFHQAARNLTTVDLSFPINVMANGSGGGNLMFSVRAWASICFGVDVCKGQGDVRLKIRCGKIEVAVARGGSSGEMVGGPKKCKK